MFPNKKIIMTAIMLAMFQSNVSADEGLAKKLIEENHLLKKQANDSESKYRMLFLEVESVTKVLKSKDDSIALLTAKNESLNEKYEAALTKSMQYDGLILQVRSLMSQSEEVQKKMLEIDGTPSTSTASKNAKQEVVEEASDDPVKRYKNVSVIKGGAVAKFKESGANLREAPSTKSGSSGETIKDDFILLTHKTKDGWYKIKDKEAWVYKDLISIN